MNYKLYLAALAGFTFTACTPTFDLAEPSMAANIEKTYEKPTPEKLELYQQKMTEVASRIKDDPKYDRIVLDTPEKKSWFKDLTYRLWDRQITKNQFIAEGLKKYPTHRYEFEFVIKGLNL
ncbi:MAG: hypothetical protein PHZ17_03735 [Sulfurovum sp.]|nr:hypothetical protein [Sulfurovum sp.]